MRLRGSVCPSTGRDRPTSEPRTGTGVDRRLDSRGDSVGNPRGRLPDRVPPVTEGVPLTCPPPPHPGENEGSPRVRRRTRTT